MTKADRMKAQTLERIMRGHVEWEKRTLADLRIAGYKFASVDQAKRYLVAMRTMATMSAQQVIDALAGIPSQEME